MQHLLYLKGGKLYYIYNVISIATIAFRESEWLFSTTDGRKNLLKMCNHTRLAIVTMHRGQKYESLQEVQDELNETVKNLAPKTMMEKVPNPLTQPRFFFYWGRFRYRFYH